MRVLIVNTSERTGGAAVAANRLKESLSNNGVKAKMLVRDKQTDDITVVSLRRGILSRWRFLWERWCIFVRLHFSRKHLFEIDIANTGHDITSLPEFKEADIIHLHWINQGMLSLTDIRRILQSGKPVVWTMHDIWPAVGICHLSLQCEQYKTACCHCPYLPSGGGNHDLSTVVWQRKQRILQGFHIHFVAVSSWLAGMVGNSGLLKGQPLTVIPNAVPLSRFRMKSKTDSRDLLHIRADKRIIIFGAARIDQPAKGFGYLKQALSLLAERHTFPAEQLLLVLFGGYKQEEVLADIAIPYQYMGYVGDEDELATLYSAADVVVSSSLSETFGQTLIEAQACGCIPVSFNNSGQTDIIRHMETGYLAEYQSAEDLARGIAWALQADIPRQQLRQHAARHFSGDAVASQYIRLYQEITAENGK